MLSTGSSQNNRLANTKERDFAIGLDNHGFRYFDPEVGRYVSPDPLGYPNGLNNYLYVGNNPINHNDPLGLLDMITHMRVTMAALMAAVKKGAIQLPAAQAAFKESLSRGAVHPDLPVMASGGSPAAGAYVTLQWASTVVSEWTEGPRTWTWERSKAAVKWASPGAYDKLRDVRNWWQDASVLEPVAETVSIAVPSVTENDVYQTHYGENVWQHSMSKGTEAAEATRDKVVNATADLVGQYHTALAEGKPDQAAFVMGQALHYLQDSWTTSHAVRNEKGKISLFQDYSKQSPTLHADEDYLKEGSPGFQRQVEHSTALIEFFGASKGKDPAAIKKELAERFYRLAKGADVGGSLQELTPRNERKR